MPYWITEKQWVCDKHVPSARISASIKKCWYGCGAERPPQEVTAESLGIKRRKLVPKEKASPEPSFIARPPLPNPPVEISARPPVTRVHKVEELRKDFDHSLEPSPTERRRGATTKAACKICGTVLWRRKSECRGDRKFVCTTHRSGK